MTVDDLIRHYRYVSHAAKNIGVCRATIYNWQRDGIPQERAKQIRKLMRGNKGNAGK